ncbi:tRNA-uridine aminocarboxypropyltransferase [Pleionea sediminis]|uniref:tRNA-uridine aminocarboxypropyltransferase n=1 Tax=Pleionea sediminis TaxID=2569479 RepID=UPI0011865953|nr:DTW domain-containing protein [Pleionea sediminis]
MSSTVAQNAYLELKKEATENANRPYHGRGILVTRCDVCQLKVSHCICNDISPMDSSVEWILIYHRDEVFKPTNTGKLIAQQFPNHTHAFLWDRIDPNPELISLLNAPDRSCYLIFPAEPDSGRVIVNSISPLPTITTFVILDATWRQARRMFNRSQWLSHIPALNLSPDEAATYSTRQAAHKHYLSTAESASLALTACFANSEAATLLNTFTIFNQRYNAMKSNIEIDSK